MYMYAEHNGRRQVVFLRCHCGPFFPRTDTAAFSGGVFPEQLNDTGAVERHRVASTATYDLSSHRQRHLH